MGYIADVAQSRRSVEQARYKGQKNCACLECRIDAHTVGWEMCKQVSKCVSLVTDSIACSLQMKVLRSSDTG